MAEFQDFTQSSGEHTYQLGFQNELESPDSNSIQPHIGQESEEKIELPSEGEESRTNDASEETKNCEGGEFESQGE